MSTVAEASARTKTRTRARRRGRRRFAQRIPFYLLLVIIIVQPAGVWPWLARLIGLEKSR